MNTEIDSILEQIARAQSAWDQYNIQSRLPTDPRSLAHGHPWDPSTTACGQLGSDVIQPPLAPRGTHSSMLF
jgi:hypothetical protein